MGAEPRSSQDDRTHARFDKQRVRSLFASFAASRDPQVREQLVIEHLNLVRYLASRFANRGEPLDDLIQVGMLGLIKAIDRFEPERGLEFTTYATPTVIGEINATSATRAGRSACRAVCKSSTPPSIAPSTRCRWS